MAIVLTAAIVVPNIGRAVLARPPRFFDGAAVMDFELRNVASARIKRVEVWARNGGADGKCDVLRINPTPLGFDDDVAVAPGLIEVATAADQIEVAYRTGGNKAAALRAVEQKCIDLGIVTLVGTVS